MSPITTPALRSTTPKRSFARRTARSALICSRRCGRGSRFRSTRARVTTSTAGSRPCYRRASSEDYGFSGAYDGSVLGGWLGYGLDVTGSIARRNDRSGQDRPVEVAPRFFGNARVLYDLPGDWPVIAVAAQFKSSARTDRSLDGGWPRMPTAPGQLELRATLSGPLPMWKALSYRFSADYAFVDRMAYLVCPHQAY